MNERRLYRYAELLQKGVISAKQQLEKNFSIKFQNTEDKNLGARVFELSGKIKLLLPITEDDFDLLRRIVRWLDAKEKSFAVDELRKLLKHNRQLPISGDLVEILNVSYSVDSAVRSLKDNLEKQYDLLKEHKHSVPNPSKFLKEYISLIETQRRLYGKIVKDSVVSEGIFARITASLRRWHANPDFAIHVIAIVCVVGTLCLAPLFLKLGAEQGRMWQQERQQVISVFEQSRRVETGRIQEIRIMDVHNGGGPLIGPVLVPVGDIPIWVSLGHTEETRFRNAEVFLNTKHGPIKIEFMFGDGTHTDELTASTKVWDKLNLVQKGQQVQVQISNYYNYIVGFDINPAK